MAFNAAKVIDAMERYGDNGSGGPPEPDSMLDVLQGFVHELRTAGLPVSMTENLDAMRALEHVELVDRAVLRAALATTLVKQERHRRSFDTVFDVYFSLHRAGIGGDDDVVDPAGEHAEASGGSGAGSQLTREQLAAMLLSALSEMDHDRLRR